MNPKPIVLRPVGGMATKDPAFAIPNECSPDMSNFQVYNGMLQKRPGYQKYKSASAFPGSRITGIYSTQDSSGVARVFATTAAGIYRYNTGTTNWDACTGPALTGAVTDLFSFETSQDGVVFSQGVDNIMLLPLAGTVYAALSAGSFPCRYLTRWNNRLYTSRLVEAGVNKPWRVRWSAFGDHTSWAAIDAGFSDLQDDVYQQQGIKKLMNALAVYTEKGIWLASKTGSAVGPASYELVVKDVGLLCPSTLTGYNTLQFFVGTDNFYTFNGIQVAPFGDLVRATIYDSIAAGSLKQNFGSLLFDTQEYLAFLCTGSNTTPDKVWAYNWSRGIMYPWTLTASPTCITTHKLDNALTIAQLIGTVAQQTWAFNSQTASATYPTLLFGATDGKVYQMSRAFASDDGVAFSAYWSSRDFIGVDVDPSLSDHKVTLKAVGIEYQDTGTPFTLAFYFSIDGGNVWSGPYNKVLGGVSGTSIRTDMVTDLQMTGNRVRFKFVNNSASESPHIISLTAHLEPNEQLVSA